MGGVGAHPQLHRDRHARRRVPRPRQDRAEQPAVHRERGTAAEPGHLGDRAAEVEVDVIDAPSCDQPAHRVGGDVGVDGVELHAADRIVLGEGGHGEGLRVALDEGARRDHLAHVEPGAVRSGRAGGTGRWSRRPWARGRPADRSRAARSRALRIAGRGAAVVFTGRLPPEVGEPRSRARRGAPRRRGSERPITLLGSPSTPSTKGADRPSRVNAPAAAMASPVERYASISASVVSAKRTTVGATPTARAARRPVDHAVAGEQGARSTTHRAQPAACLGEHSPVCRGPVPRTRRASRSRRPPRRRLEARPRLRLPLGESTDQRGGVLGIDPFSSTPLSSTTGSNPASEEEPEPGGRARGEHEGASGHPRSVESALARSASVALSGPAIVPSTGVSASLPSTGCRAALHSAARSW